MDSFGKKNEKHIPSSNILQAIDRCFDKRMREYFTGNYSKIVCFYSKEI